MGLHELGANLILLLVLLHIAMILFYRHWKREDLVTPMLTGMKKVPEAVAQSMGDEPPTPQGERDRG